MWLASVAGLDAQVSSQIRGSVADATGAPLANVTVTLAGPVNLVAKTDASGQFVFAQLPDGDYELTAALESFATALRTIHLTAGVTEPVSLTLAVGAFEQVVVAAARIGETNVQQTPMAVSALPAADLEDAQVYTVADIAGRAPSVTFSQNSDFSQLTIRGIGTNVVFAGSDPSSAIYVDGVYLARPVMALGDFLDLERVEVLRGPQGTLYGRNAVGGALNVITKEPTSSFETSARLISGTRNTLRGEARVSGPIVRDRVFGRGAILRGIGDGFVIDVDHPNHPLGGEDVFAARGKLLVKLASAAELGLSADTTRQDPAPLNYAKVLAVKPGFVVNNPEDPREVRTSTLAQGYTRQSGAAARLIVQLTPDTRLASLTAFRKLDYNVINDADISELDLTSVDLHEQQHQLSEEITVARTGDGMTWIGGLLFFSENDRQPTAISLRAQGLTNVLNPEVHATSRAGFGQATLPIASHLSLTGGLRVTRERKTFDNEGYLFAPNNPGVFLPGAYDYTDAISHTSWTPKAGVEIRTGRRTFTYFSATRGFKSGGFNITSPEAGRGFAPEWAWSYEGGIKTQPAGGRAQLNAAVFYTDYTNLQVQTAIRPGVIDISNAAAATIHGVEIEGAGEISRTLRAGGHLAWLDAAYDQYVAVGVGGVTGDVAGNRLNNAPAWSGGAWAEWIGNAGRVRELSIRADVLWQTTVYFTPFNDPVQRQRPYGLLGLSVTYRPQPWWTLGVHAQNLTNTAFITGTFSSPPPAIGGRPGEPRRVTVSLTLER